MKLNFSGKTDAAWRQQQEEARQRAEEEARQRELARQAEEARRRAEAARLLRRVGAPITAERNRDQVVAGNEAARAQMRHVTGSVGRDTGLLTGEVSRFTARPSSPSTRPAPDHLTPIDLTRLGSDIPGGGPQLFWTGDNPGVVGTITDRARQQGLLSDELLNANAALANQAVTGDDRRRLTPEEFAGLAQAAGIPLERLDPQQAVQATHFINRATDAQNQRDRITWSLSNLQLAAGERLPKLSREDQIEIMWAAARVPGHALQGLSDRDLAAAFDRVALATNTPGPSEVKVGRHTLHVQVGADGTIHNSETKPPGFWSRVGGFFESVGGALASGALSVFRAVAGPITNAILNEDQRIEPTKSYAELSPQQRSLLGPGGQAFWDDLSALQRGGFILLTQRMDRLELDYSGLTIRGGRDGIEQAKLHMDGPAWALRRFQESIEAAIDAGRLISERPAGIFHGGENDVGGRENRGTLSIQVGVGPAGAFVDIDRYNPQGGFGNLLLHNLVEVFGASSPPNPFDAADKLGEDLGHR